MKRRPGPFIVIEALDAGGSQTQTDRLAKRLKKAKYDVLQLHFPQEDQPTGRFIYDKFLLSKNKPGFTRREQAALYLQDFYSRADDIARHLIKPKSIVVSDRFYTSTLAYQSIGLAGQARHRIIKWISALAETGTPRLPKPTHVIFLDTPVNVSLKHLATKRKDYFENRARLTAIRNSYRRLATERHWTTINSVNERGEQRSIQDIHQEIWQHLEASLP